jgi:hypothetical protein
MRHKAHLRHVSGWGDFHWCRRYNSDFPIQVAVNKLIPASVKVTGSCSCKCDGPKRSHQQQQKHMPMGLREFICSSSCIRQWAHANSSASAVAYPNRPMRIHRRQQLRMPMGPHKFIGSSSCICQLGPAWCIGGTSWEINVGPCETVSNISLDYGSGPTRNIRPVH